MRPILPVLGLLSLSVNAQQITPIHLTDLPVVMNEISGMVVLDGQVWGIMDSWNPALLYQADPHTGVVGRTLAISNATNTDWEALTMDADHVYVGDIGNNYGIRSDLRILRFPLTALRNEAVTEVEADVIAYTYADQQQFVPVRDGTNWDCEALLAVGDSLWLFTKNWVDQRTYRYVLPARPGTWQAVRRDTLEAGGLITDAALHPERGSVILLGHTMGVEPFLWHLAAFPVGRPFAGNVQRNVLAMPPAQTESVAWGDGDTLLLGQERIGDVPAKLWQVLVDPALGGVSKPEPTAVRLYPNPASDQVWVHHGGGRAVVRLLDSAGRPLYEGKLVDGERMDLRGIPPGIHCIEVERADGVQRQRLIVAR